MCQIMTPRTCNFLLAFFLLLTKLQVCWFNFFALSPPLIPSRCSHMIQGFCYPLLLVSHSWKVHLNDFTWHSLLAKNEGGPQIHNLRQRGNNLWQRRHYQLFNFSATLQLYTSSRNQINQAFDISTKVVSDVRYESPVFWCPHVHNVRSWLKIQSGDSEAEREELRRVAGLAGAAGCKLGQDGVTTLRTEQGDLLFCEQRRMVPIQSNPAAGWGYWIMRV